MDLTCLFCDIDDFCNQFSVYYNQCLLEEGHRRRHRQNRMSLSEMMTLVIYYHHPAGGYRNFKNYYQHYVEKYLTEAFPGLLSYSRFMDLFPRLLVPMSAYLNTRKGKVTGIAFVDSLPWKGGRLVSVITVEFTLTKCSKGSPKEAKVRWVGFMVSSSI